MSRPKRLCKDAAIRAIGFEEDEEDDIYDDSERDDDAEAPEENEDLGNDVPDDDLLNEDQLTELDSEESESDNSDEEEVEAYTSPSGCRWTANVNFQGRAPARNIIRFRPAVKRGVNPVNERDSVLMFIDDVITTAVRFSNVQGRRNVVTWNRVHPRQLRRWQMIDRTEMEAFIGLLILLGKRIACLRVVIYL